MTIKNTASRLGTGKAANELADEATAMLTRGADKNEAAMLLSCELCSRPAPILYDVAVPWLVAAVCPACEPAVRGCAA